MTGSDTIRRGGLRGPDGRYMFELVGRPSLDLANTLDERGAGGRELLPTYWELLDWTLQTGLLAPERERALRHRAERHPVKAGRARLAAQELREVLFRVFSAAADGRPAPAADQKALNGWLEEAGRRRRLEWRGTMRRLTFETRPDELDAMLWPVVADAVDLLVSEDLKGRIRTCQGPACAWLFLDRSRRGDRKWCDMSVCGNRAKARRFHAREKAVGGRGSS